MAAACTCRWHHCRPLPCVALLLLTGCAANKANVQQSPGSQPGALRSSSFRSPAGAIDLSAVEDDLRSFENAFQALVENASDSIADHASDPQVQRACVLWRTRVITQVSDAISSAEPAVALLEVWSICLEQRDYLAAGQGARLFGADQPAALDAARRALAMIEDIADRHLSRDQHAAAAEQIRAYAKQHPYSGAFDNPSPAPLRMNTSALSGLKAIIGLPLAPAFTAQKFNQGVNTIRDWAPTINRLTDVIEDYPRSVRWQADRLLLDLDRAASFQLAIQGVNRVSDTADRLRRTFADFQPVADRYAELIQSLPADTASQVQSVLLALDRNQTTRSATRSLERISATSEQLVATAQSLPVSLQQALDRSSQAAGTQGRDLVDHIAWRSAQILVLAAGLAGGLIVLSRVRRRAM